MTLLKLMTDAVELASKKLASAELLATTKAAKQGGLELARDVSIKNDTNQELAKNLGHQAVVKGKTVPKIVKKKPKIYIEEPSFVDEYLGRLGRLPPAWDVPIVDRTEQLISAQRNASLPISEGGLGLRPGNTQADRAAVTHPVHAFHETSAKNAATMDSFIPTNSVASAQDEVTPFGVFTKPTGKSIGLHRNAVQMPLQINPGNTLEVENRTKLLELLNKYPEIKQHTDDVRKLARRYYDYDKKLSTIIPKDIEDLHIEQLTSKAYLAKKAITEKLIELGYDSLRIKSDRGLGTSVDTTVVLDPKNVRSQSAAFDPFLRNSSDIMAGVLPLSLTLFPEKESQIVLPEKESQVVLPEKESGPLTEIGYATGGLVADEDLTRPAFRTPLILKRSEARQDRAASAGVPLAAARGFVAGTLGMPGDIEGLIRLITPGVSNESFLPNTEHFLKSLPLNQDTPVARAFGEIGSFAGSPVLLKAIAPVASAGKAGARLVGEEFNRALLDTSGALSKLIPEAVKPMYVVKPKGGNWLTGSVEERIKNLKRGTPSSTIEAQSVDTWIDKTLTKYIKNEMATPEDPVRLLADAWPAKRDAKLAEKQKQLDRLLVKLDTSDPRAHAGINRSIEEVRGQMDVVKDYLPLHTSPETVSANYLRNVRTGEGFSANYLRNVRTREGFPAEGMGHTQESKVWEQVADEAIQPALASARASFRNPVQRLETDPWLATVPPETAVYSAGKFDNLGLNHLVDELRNATNAASGLPRNLLIDPADLGKITMEQAVTRVADINAWRVAQKVEGNMSLANNAATTVFKEYAENNPKGLKWVQLKDPIKAMPDGWSLQEFEGSIPGSKIYGVVDSRGHLHPDAAGKQPTTPEIAIENFKRGYGYKELSDALKYEGDTMGHCVGGYCPDVTSGKSQIFSLRDAKGRPHVTVEVQPGKGDPISDKFRELDQDTMDQIRAAAMVRDSRKIDWGKQGNFLSGDEADLRRNLMREATLERFPEWAELKAPDNIIQIKGKGNKKPVDEYLPFVQDFVKSGQWSDVGDLGNTGLYKASDFAKEFTPDQLRSINATDYLTLDEIQKLRTGKPWTPVDTTPTLDIADDLLPPARGMAKGGIVSFAKGGVVSTHTEYNPALIGAMVHDLQEEIYAN